MASGQPMGPAPQGQYPGYAPVYQPAHKQPIEYLRPVVSDVLLALGLVIGLFLLMLGWIIFGVADTGAGRDAGQVVKALGLFVLSAVMFLGGLIRADMDKWVRSSLIIGAVLLISWVGFWTIYY